MSSVKRKNEFFSDKYEADYNRMFQLNSDEEEDKEKKSNKPSKIEAKDEVKPKKEAQKEKTKRKVEKPNIITGSEKEANKFKSKQITPADIKNAETILSGYGTSIEDKTVDVRAGYHIRRDIYNRLQTFNERQLVKNTNIVSILIDAYISKGYITKELENNIANIYKQYLYDESFTVKENSFRMQIVMPENFKKALEEKVENINSEKLIAINVSVLLSIIIDDFLTKFAGL